MARKVSKIGSLLGMESKARSRKAGSVDLAKIAGTKVPRMLWDTFGGAEIPILESAFSKWEDKRNKLAGAKIKKHEVDAKYHKGSDSDKAAEDMVNEARKSRQDAKEAQQDSKAHQVKLDSYNSAMADQGSSQIKMLSAIRSELIDIKGVLKIGGKQVGHGAEAAGGNGMLGTIWNLLPNKLKGKLGGKAAEIAEKLGGKKLGSIVKLAATAAGAEGLEKTAAEVAGSGIGAAAKSVAPEAAEVATKAAGGGILGKITGMGKSALGAASGVVDSGKSALGKVGGWFGGKAKSAEGLLGEGVGKLAGKEGEKVGGEELGKLGGKMLLKEGGKAIPLLGNIIGLGTSLGFAGKRLWEGDMAGAAMETGSGLLNLIPGVGNYLSIAADLAIAGRDLKKANAAKKLVGAGAGAAEKGKEANEATKTMKEVSEEGAKVVEEKADAGDEKDDQNNKEQKKTQSKLSQIAAQISPIQTASAADTVPASRMGGGNLIKGITAVGAGAAGVTALSAAAANTNAKASPIDRLVSYMAGLFDLAQDDQKGIYVRMSKAPFQDMTSDQQKQAQAMQQPAAATTPGPSTISSGGGTSSASPSSSYIAPSYNGSGGGSTPMQPGAATNGGWAPGNGGGTLKFNEAGAGGAQPSSIGAATKSYGKAGGFDIDQMWDQMKDTIASGESGKAGYDAHHGGTIQGLSNMTIGQIRKMKGAMGKYQLLPGTTLGEAAKGVGLSDSDLFSPANQEAMGKWLFARRVKKGASGGAAGIQQQLAYEWASLPKDASGRGAYDGDSAGNMAAGGSQRGQALASMISGSTGGSSGSMSGAAANTANTIDEATQEVAKGSTDGQPTVVVAGGGGGGGGGTPQAAPGTGNGLSGPMVTRNSDSSVQAITQNFIAGSSAMG